MVKIKFFKYQGIGNDFILIEDFEKKMPKNKEFIVHICDRHFGIGADGIIYAQKEKHNFRMKLFNPDGTEPEMCGNGIRCLAKHLHNFGYVKEKKFEIETNAGIKKIEMKTKSVVVEIGKPEFLGSVNILGEQLQLISMGNPHAVVFKEKIDMDEFKEKAPRIEAHPYFPNRTNVEFVHVVNKKRIHLFVYERGVGYTLACGTGACASVAAATKQNLVDAGIPITVKLPGGELTITLEKDFSKIWMEGSVELVFEGKII